MKLSHQELLLTDSQLCVFTAAAHLQQTTGNMASQAFKYPSWSTPTKTYHNNEELRIVMVGKTGAGKSATGNTILGKEVFKSKFSAQSLTECCKKVFGEVHGQRFAVIDTPGLFDTRTDEEKTKKDIAQSISFASPGPNIFLIVIKLDRFTDEEKKTVHKIQEMFGEEANKYSMVLFTHGDLLKGTPIEEFLLESEELQELVDKCNGQYHVFNNELKDRSQVRELFTKIREITEKNGGSHYTTKMFQRAEEAIEDMKQQILKENEEKNRKELEKLERQMKERFEKEMRETKADIERKNQLIEAQKKEVEEKLKQIKENQEKEARWEAERNASVIDRIVGFICDVVKVVRQVFK